MRPDLVVFWFPSSGGRLFFTILWSVGCSPGGFFGVVDLGWIVGLATLTRFGVSVIGFCPLLRAMLLGISLMWDLLRRSDDPFGVCTTYDPFSV